MPFMLAQPRLKTCPPYVFFESAFTPDECARVVGLANTHEMHGALLADGMPGDKRRAEIAWVPWSADTDWLHNRLAGVCDEIRLRWYPFHLSAFAEHLQLTRYTDKDAGHYGMHRDMGDDGLSTRKLSLVLMLSDPKDYEGGGLRLAAVEENGGQVAHAAVGTVIAFPSWEPHEVLPVTRGERWSLVAWAHGPPFA